MILLGLSQTSGGVQMQTEQRIFWRKTPAIHNNYNLILLPQSCRLPSNCRLTLQGLITIYTNIHKYLEKIIATITTTIKSLFTEVRSIFS